MCRQGCVVPRCQVRESQFTWACGQWALWGDTWPANATIDWRPGQTGAELTVYRSGGVSQLLKLNQSALLLCEGYRYTVTAILRSLKARGQVTVRVTGGDENGYVDLLPEPLTAALSGTAVAVTQDFEVNERWSNAEVCAQRLLDIR